jgi:hypothetical protein
LPALYFIKDIEEMVGLFVLFGEVDIWFGYRLNSTQHAIFYYILEYKLQNIISFNEHNLMSNHLDKENDSSLNNIAKMIHPKLPNVIQSKTTPQSNMAHF